MKANMIKILLFMSFLSFLWSTGALAGERYTDRNQKRMDRQAHRVERGVRHGNITGGEYGYIKKEQRHIRSAHNRAREDGPVGRHERHRIDKMQDRASRYPRHPSPYHYGHHRPRHHPHPMVHKYSRHRYCRPYPAPFPFGLCAGHVVAGCFDEAGWTLSFTTGGAW